jgi:DNA-directed RNA polymerase specialized sigma24 family protein
MCPHAKAEIVWPELDSSYVDEFGLIDGAIYEIAREVWPAVVPSILRTLRDLQAGQTTMMKAAALVSRKLNENPEKITNVHGYLYRTFIRLLNYEIEKEGKHAEFDRVLSEKNQLEAAQLDEALFEKILVSQLLARIDSKTRIMLQLRMLGYTFEEIAREQDKQSNHLRSEWSKVIRRLAAIIESEMREAERQASKPREHK